MLQNNNFKGELDGKTIKDFLDKLNYNLNQDDRVKLVNELINTQKVGTLELPDQYFEQFFEQKEVKNGLNASHMKVNVNKTDGLSENNEVCKALEKIANYILFSPDGERITKKTKYNFYTEETLDMKLNKEPSYEGFVNRNNGDEEEVIDFLVRKGKNYKNCIKQKIYTEDLKDEELECVAQYEESINNLRQQSQSAKNNEDMRLKRLCDNQIGSMKVDQLMCKDMLKGTIYFKQALADSTEIDYDKFDYSNKEHVMALLKVTSSQDFNNDIYCMICDLENTIKKCDFSKAEQEVMRCWREKDSTQEGIAKTLGVTQQSINKTLSRICSKISSKYMEDYEDWYYLNVEKGKYKKCSKCGEVKLVSKFSAKKGSADGLQGFCKECDKNRKK